MLNARDDRNAIAGHQSAAKIAAVQEEFQRRIRQSRRLPFSIFSRGLLAVYLIVLVLAGTLARLLSRQPPGPLVRRLASEYPNVPEMVLHKAIELTALARRTLRGRGLDLGCGDGAVGGVLIETAGLDHLDGVDVTAIAGDAVKARGYSTYTRGDIQALPFSASSFDYLVSVCVVEHVPNLDRLIGEAARVLRPGGELVFTTPSPGFHEGLVGYRLLRALGFSNAADRFRRFKDLLAMQHHYLRADEWRNYLALRGFRDVTVEPIFTRQQLSAYDLLNCQVYAPRLFFYEHLSGWLGRSETLRTLVVWAISQLSASLMQARATDSNHTHFCIACRRID